MVAPLIYRSGVTSDALADTTIKRLGGLAPIKPQNFHLPSEYVNHNTVDLVLSWCILRTRSHVENFLFCCGISSR